MYCIVGTLLTSKNKKGDQMKYYNYVLPYELKATLLTALLSILTLGAKKEVAEKQTNAEPQNKISTFNTVIAVNMKNTYNMADLIKKDDNQILDFNTVFGVDTNNNYNAQYVEETVRPMDSVQNIKNIKQQKKKIIKTVKPKQKQTEIVDSTRVRIVTGKKTVKYIYPDGSIEIRQGGTLPWRNKNPGALESSKTAIGKANRFAVFASEKEGMDAIRILLLGDSYRNLSLKDAVFKYAPPHENNTKKYQNDLKRLTGLDINRKLCDLNDEEMESVVKTIKQLEGWKAGRVTFIASPQRQVIDTLNQRTL